MATDNENKPQRRVDDQHPDAKIDWSKPEAPAVPLSSTAGAAKGGITNEENSSVPPLTAPAPLTDLHAAIMNIPCKRADHEFMNAEHRMLYKNGHRDARHAAAELALSVEAAPALRQSESIITPKLLERLIDEHTDRDFGLIVEPFARAIEAEIAKAAPAAPVQTAEPYAYEQDNGADTELIYAAWFANGLGAMDPDCIYRPLYLAASAQTDGWEIVDPAGMVTRLRTASQSLLDAAVKHVGWKEDSDMAIATEAVDRALADCVGYVAAPVQADQAQAEPTNGTLGAPVPDHILDAIREYGDQRADSKATSLVQMGNVILALRRHYRAAPALPAQAEQVEAVRATVLEEAAKVADSHYYGPCGEYDYSYDDASAKADDRAEQIAAAIRALAKEAAIEAPSQWISVEDRLPDLHVTVALLDENRWMNTGSSDHNVNWHGAGYLCEFGQKYWRIFGEMRSQCMEAVTHWMPIPAAPITTPSNDTSALGDTGGDHG